MTRLDDIFRDIRDIERLILEDEKYYELVDRYTMASESKRDEQKEVYNWDDR